MEHFVLFIFGLFIGSFLNTMITRISKREKLSYKPSHCQSCGERLTCKDLIPLISFFQLRGKCRYCKEKISIRYPMVELLTGVVYFLASIRIANQFYLISVISFLSILIVIVFIENLEKVLNKNLLALLISLAFISIIFRNHPIVIRDLLYHVYGGGFSAAIYYTYLEVKKEKIDMDKARFLFIIGLFLGIRETIIMYLIASGLGIKYIMGDTKEKDFSLVFSFGVAFSVTLLFARYIIEILI